MEEVDHRVDLMMERNLMVREISFFCYKCNNPGHIARNCRALESQNGTNQKTNTPVC